MPKRINWSAVINELENRGLVRTRMTDHQFQKDPRNILNVKGFRLTQHVPIGALPSHKENEYTDLALHLIRLLDLKTKTIPNRFMESYEEHPNPFMNADYHKNSLRMLIELSENKFKRVPAFRG